MNVQSVRNIGASAAGEARVATDAPSRERREVPQHGAEVDKLTQQPVPPRFPWLSRLALHLEHAAGRRAPFDAAPIIGDRLDRSA